MSGIDSSVDGYHTKCATWHNVGNCPLDIKEKVASTESKSNMSVESVPFQSQPAQDTSHATSRSITQRKNILASQIQSLRLELKKYNDEKNRLEAIIPSASVSVSPFATVCCILVIAAAVYVGIVSQEFIVGLLSAAVGIWLVSTACEAIEEDLTKKRKHHINRRYANEISLKAEIEQSIIKTDNALSNLYNLYDSLNKQQRLWWKKLDGWAFEKEVAKVFRLDGYEANVTRGSNDGGIDVNLYKNGQHTIVQCKNHRSAIGPAPIRDLFGVLKSVGAARAIIVSQTAYTKGAVDFASKHGIELMTIDDLIEIQKLRGVN